MPYLAMLLKMNIGDTLSFKYDVGRHYWIIEITRIVDNRYSVRLRSLIIDTKFDLLSTDLAYFVVPIIEKISA